MSKYSALWQAVSQHEESRFFLTFSQIEEILGFPIDHAFLTYKKELMSFGWQVEKISMKGKTVEFIKL